MREHGDNESVARSGVRKGEGGSAGLHKGVHMLQRAANSLSGAVASRPLHTGEDFADDGVIAAVINLEGGASHFDGGGGPLVTQTHQVRSRNSANGRCPAKALCYRNRQLARQTFRESAGG